MIALTSVGDAPGATTTAFALALSWPGRVLLAECSPAGGKLLRGYFQCSTPPDHGLWEVALAAVHGVDTALEALWEQVLAVDEQQERLLLAGLPDPFQASQLSAATWETLAGMLGGLAFTVLADTGPITPEQPYAVLRAAELVLVVMRPTLAQVAAARPRLARLRAALGPHANLGLCLIGDKPYTPSEIRGELGDFTLILRLPFDRRAAEVLTNGSGNQQVRRRVEMSMLMRSARTATRSLASAIGQRQIPATAVEGGGR